MSNDLASPPPITMVPNVLSWSPVFPTIQVGTATFADFDGEKRRNDNDIGFFGGGFDDPASRWPIAHLRVGA